MTHDMTSGISRPCQLDALREVANIGAGHAATALSQMINSRIMIDVPQLQVAASGGDAGAHRGPGVGGRGGAHAHAGRPDRPHAADAPARVRDAAWRRSCCAASTGSLKVFGELEQSAIKEAGNILCAAYMNALSDFMGLMLLPSVPGLVIDLCAAVLTTVSSDFAAESRLRLHHRDEFVMDESREASPATSSCCPTCSRCGSS